MGHTTDYIGYLDVFPPLNVAEQEYLLAFRETRHCVRPRGPYVLAGNPLAEQLAEPRHHESANTIGEGQPSFWCQWMPGWGGYSLAFDGREKFYGGAEWLQYRIDHFLAPDARASYTGLPCFDEFTFNHTVEGIVAGSRRDTRELFLLDVKDNVVRRKVLLHADPSLEWHGLLPYEEEWDRVHARMSRRRRGDLAAQ